MVGCEIYLRGFDENNNRLFNGVFASEINCRRLEGDGTGLWQAWQTNTARRGKIVAIEVHLHEYFFDIRKTRSWTFISDPPSRERLAT